MATLYKIEKPHTPFEKKTRTVVDTILVTPKLLETWKSPIFQRPVRQNEKVRALAEELRDNGGVWPGIITLGILDGITYVIDGQHRKESFLLSGLAEGYTDVRIHYFTSLADMGEEFVRLNSQLVSLRPDDILRGLEPSLPGLKKIRNACPYIGYDCIRRNPTSPVMGMAAVLRSWRSSAGEVPGSHGGGLPAAAIASSMTEPDFDDLIGFLQIVVAAFGRDSQYARLYSMLNMTMCMWMYHRLVLKPELRGKVEPLTREQFKKCLMSVSAASDYIDWLLGRQLGERDRAPAYNRLKTIFAARMAQDVGHKINLPQPSWVSR